MHLREKQRGNPSVSEADNLDSWHGSVGVHGLPEDKDKMPSLLLARAEVSGAHALLMGLEVPAQNRP